MAARFRSLIFSWSSGSGCSCTNFLDECIEPLISGTIRSPLQDLQPKILIPGFQFQKSIPLLVGIRWKFGTVLADLLQKISPI